MKFFFCNMCSWEAKFDSAYLQSYALSQNKMAATTKVHTLLEAAIKEAKLDAFEDLVAFLSAHMDIDHAMQTCVDQFKRTLVGTGKVANVAGTVGKKMKHKQRSASAYNLYLRDKMAELRAAGHRGNVMKLAVEYWNSQKASAGNMQAAKGQRSPAVV